MSTVNSVSSIGEFVLKNGQNETITALANKIGISQSYLSSIIKGHKTPTIEVCNKIADAFNASRISIYTIMGWLDSIDDNELPEEIKRLIHNDPFFPELVRIYASIPSEADRAKAVRMLGAFFE